MNLKGVLFVILLGYSSTLGAIFFIGPLIPLVYFQPALGRRLLDQMIWLWQVYAVAVVEKVCGVKIVITGKPMPEHESGLLLMNHRTRFDWLFMMSYQLRCGSLRHFKISLKKSLKNVPGPGWAMQSAGYIFLHRKWEIDQRIMTRCISYFHKVKHKPQVLLFPEGTDLTANTMKRSDKYATDNDLQKYHYVLHPRTTGFVFLVEKMREYNLLDSILDVDVGYPKYIPQGEKDILKGNLPSEVHFNVNLYSDVDVPLDKDGIDKWCRSRWQEKEQKLKDYYMGDRQFAGPTVDPAMQQKEDYVQHLFTFSLVFWNVFQIVATIFLIYAPVVRWYTLLCGLGFILVSKYGGMGKFLASTVTQVEP
ncbi:lysocardiolipin acyltransferase 1-like [Argopecten irradians]|uniref:lysocardiolipin acyltransferase 1-like n=1 Tax=Argopecten irradians TaxID=31199 RepID=UPI003716E0D1